MQCHHDAVIEATGYEKRELRCRARQMHVDHVRLQSVYPPRPSGAERRKHTCHSCRPDHLDSSDFVNDRAAEPARSQDDMFIAVAPLALSREISQEVLDAAPLGVKLLINVEDPHALRYA
jgi:hypothetical protein